MDSVSPSVSDPPPLTLCLSLKNIHLKKDKKVIIDMVNLKFSVAFLNFTAQIPEVYSLLFTLLYPT